MTASYNTHRPIGFKVQPNEILNLNHFYKVLEHKVTHAGPVVVVQSTSDPSQVVEVSESLIDQQFYSSDYYAEEVEIPLTEAEKILLGAGENIFSVGFTKLDNSERTLRGYLTGSISLGRAQVIDAELNQVRQVDLRTLNFLIYKGVRYVVKGSKKKTISAKSKK